MALFAMLLTVLLIAKFQSNKWHEWDNKEKTFRTIVRSDGAGYYAYLPQIFIFQDNRFRFIERMKKRYPDAKMGEFGNTPDDLDGTLNKYFCGVAMCQAPFFIATRLTHSSKHKIDGYSLPYQKSVAIAAIFFLLLGLWLSYLVLLHFRIQPWVAAFSITIFALGTTLLYYSVNEVLTAHAYSFTLIAAFVYSLIRWKESKALKWLLMVVFTYAWVILLRPSNGIVFILFFAVFVNLKESWRFLKDNFLNKPSHYLSAILVFGAMLFIQFANVKYQTGHWGFNIYANEGFDNWNKPPFMKVLFSFKKGLFIYAPLFFVSLFGFWFFRKEYRFANRIILIFILLFTYVTASWWNWYYGGSLGMRPFIDVSLFFMLGLAFLLQYAKNWLRIILLPIITFCVYYSFILTIQLDTAILHFADMNKERFFRIFLKTDDRFAWVFHLEEPKSFDNRIDLVNVSMQNIQKRDLKLRPYEIEIEHMRLEPLFQIPIDERFKTAFGIRIHQGYQIRDHHNLPWLYYEVKKDSVWKNVHADLLGMRIPTLNKTYFINSDLFLNDEIRNADSLRVLFHNTHGKTTIEGDYPTRVQFFEKK